MNKWIKVVHHKVASLFLITAFIFSTGSVLYAEEFTSSSYKVIDPVLAPSGFGTSTDFQLWGTISENAVGTSSSASYTAKSGFLTFPYAAIATASTTVGDTTISVNWTPTIGYGGWTVTSYSVGQATVHNGPYTYTNVSNVTTSLRTGLTNGTLYYFVVTANDIFGNVIATSTEVSATPIASGFTFTLSNNAAYFGTLSSSATAYASSTNANGSPIEVEAHHLEVNTGAPGGYSLTVRGQTLTSAQNAGNTITALLSNTAPSIGGEQFGLRVVATGGNGIVSVPYAASGFAYGATATSSSQIGSATTGNSATTTYSVRFMTNIAPLTEAGNYSGNFTYVATANF